MAERSQETPRLAHIWWRFGVALEDGRATMIVVNATDLAREREWVRELTIAEAQALRDAPEHIKALRVGPLVCVDNLERFALGLERAIEVASRKQH